MPIERRRWKKGPEYFIDLLDSSRLQPVSLFTKYGRWLHQRHKNLHAANIIECLARKALYEASAEFGVVESGYDGYFVERSQDTLKEVRAYGV